MATRFPDPLERLIARFTRNPLLQRVIRNSGYLLSGSTLSALLSMVQGILAARLLGIAGFGLLGTITQFASVINRLTSFRMGELVVSYVGEYSAQNRPQHAAAVFKAAALTETASTLLAYLLLLALAPLGARYLAHDAALAPLFSLYGLIILANLIAESSTGLLQYFDRFRSLAGIAVGQSALTLLLIAGAFFAQAGLQAVVVAYLVGKVVWAAAITGAALWQARRVWGAGWWRVSLALLKDRRRDLFRFAFSTNLTGTLTLVTKDSEILWLSALSTPLQVGYYKVALRIINVLLIPIQPLISTTYREVAREVASRQWQNVRYLLRSGSLISAAYSLAAALGMVIFGRWVVALHGEGFLPTSYQAMLILLAGVTVVNVFYWNRTVLLPLGLPEYPTKVNLVAAVLKVAGMLLIVPRAGAMGMAVLLSAFFAGTGGVLVWKTLKEIRRAAALPAASPGS